MTRIQTKSSNTAKLTCYQRALGYLEVGPPEANDYIAPTLLSPQLQIAIKDPLQRAQRIAEVSPTYAYLSARTAHLDQVTLAVIEQDFAQVVILGAGYDTRAYRLLADADLRVYEVDAPTSQQAKRKYLGFANVTVPDNLAYVAIDFNTESLSDAFSMTSYDPAAKTLFIWEGVTYYISAAAVTATLKFVKENSASQSIIAFDYLYSEVLAGDYSRYGAEEGANYVRSVGEPFTFGLTEDTITPFLTQRGFTLKTHYNPLQFGERYLSAAFPRPYEYMANVVAEVA